MTIGAGFHELWPTPIGLHRYADAAGIAQLVEHNLAKVGVAGSSPVSRSSGG